MHSSSSVVTSWYYLVILVITICFGPLSAVLAGTPFRGGIPVAISVSVLILLSHILRWILGDTPRGYLMALFRAFMVTMCLPAFFAAVAAVVLSRTPAMHDAELLSWDVALLGWLFPQGQLALFLDTAPYISPSSFLGRFIVEILNVFYISYYVWGYAVFVLLGGYCLYYHFRPAGSKEEEKHEALKRLETFVGIWAAGFLVTFFMNLSVPAVSPRLYLKPLYKTEITGFGLAKLTRSAFEVDKSFGTFPSGHVSESYAIAWAASCILTPNKWHMRFRYWLWLASTLIAIATLWLRYHYVIDVVVGLLVTILVIITSPVSPLEKIPVLVAYMRGNAVPDIEQEKPSAATPPISSWKRCQSFRINSFINEYWQVIGYCTFYSLAAIISSLTIKRVVTYPGFSPFVASFLLSFTSVICIGGAYLFNVIPFDIELSALLPLIPSCLTFAALTVTNLTALHYLSLPVFLVIKQGLGTAVVNFGTCIIFQQRVSRGLAFSFITMTAISLVSIFSSSAFHPAGYALSFCSILLTILYNTSLGLSHTSLKEPSVSFLNNFVSSALLLPTIFITGKFGGFELAFSNLKLCIFVLLAGFSALFFTCLSPYCAKHLSATAFSCMEHSNYMAIAAFGWILFYSQLSGLVFACVIAALCATSFFIWIKITQPPSQSSQPERVPAIELVI